jgi:hypothetical protein
MVSIWPLTIKSQSFPWLTCLKRVCDIFLERYWQGLQLFFKPRLNRRSAQESMDVQSVKSLNFGNFGTLYLGVLGKTSFGCNPLWRITKNIIRGKVVALPKSRLWWVLWICVCMWLVYAPKMFQLCTNKLVVWFVQINMNNWLTCQSS